MQGPTIVEEQIDRFILWICKYNPDLQGSLSKDSGSGHDAEQQLLEESFEACTLGLRLLAFHVAFLKLIARPAGTSFVQVSSYSSAQCMCPSSAARLSSAKRRLPVDFCFLQSFTLRCEQHVLIHATALLLSPSLMGHRQADEHLRLNGRPNAKFQAK